MTEELQVSSEQLQQQVDELSAMVDLLHRAVAALQTAAPEERPASIAVRAGGDSAAQPITPRDLHPSVPLTENSRRRLLELARSS
jgi:hypothetical protein